MNALEDPRDLEKLQIHFPLLSLLTPPQPTNVSPHLAAPSKLRHVETWPRGNHLLNTSDLPRSDPCTPELVPVS